VEQQFDQGRGIEQRRTRRRPLTLRVSGPKVYGTTENMSKGGMFLQTDEALALGETVVVNRSSPGLLDPRQVSGIVVRRRSRSPELRAGVGIAFIEDSAETISFLADLPDDASEPSADMDLAAEAVQLPPYKVLVIEDDPQIAKLYGRALVKVEDGYARHLAVELAADGQEAFRLLCRTPYDLLVTDLMMPVMDGFTLIERVRAHPRISHMKILVISGGSPDDLVRARNSGADAVVAKPTPLRDVLKTVRELLRIRPIPRTPTRSKGESDEG
jgi:CheY-like chemotaxis protein